MVIDDMRKTFEAVLDQLSPARAREVAKRYLEPEAAKDQVAKTANELVQLSQRLRETVRREVRSQMRSMGVATQEELDALRKRVRDLERASGKSSARTTAGRGTTRTSAARKTSSRAGTRRTTTRTPTARKTTG
jgi:predicted  nucleic acid-binding Zn-ribbon protein